MTPYEFTRFESDWTRFEKAKGYDLGTIEFLISHNNPNKDFRATKEYKDAYDTFIELTMSCTLNEATKQAEYWVVNAIAYGNQTQDRYWMTLFLAANDLYEYLLSQKKVGARYV